MRSVPDRRTDLAATGLYRAATRLGHTLAPWRWQLGLAVVMVEAVLSRSDQPLDAPMFALRGSDILHGRFSAVYSQSYNQGGPLQLLGNRFLLIGSHADHVAILTMEFANILLLATAYLVCRGRRGRSPNDSSREAVVVGLVALWLAPDSLWSGHVVEVAIPMLWMLGARNASFGRSWRAGLFLALATAIAPWGALGGPVVLLSPRRRQVMAAAAIAIAVGAGAYLPFVLSGNFQLLHFHWAVEPQSLVAQFWPHVHVFSWYLRLIQAALAGGACAFVAMGRRDSAVWLAPLAAVAVRVFTDPMEEPYYWQPVAVCVIAGIALGAPRVRTRSGLLAVGALAYLPYLSTKSLDLRLYVGGACLVALGLLAIQGRGETSAREADSQIGPASRGCPAVLAPP